MTVPQEISNADLKQLLHYMSRIKGFEKIFKIQSAMTIRLIWGLLIIGAGVLEFVITQLLILNQDYSTSYSEFLSQTSFLTIIPWIFALSSALIIQLFSDRHITNIYSYETKKIGENTDTFFLLRSFILMVLIVQIFALTDLLMLAYPSITLIAGFTAYVIASKQYLKFQEVITRRTHLIIPISTGLAIIVMVSGNIISPMFFQYLGLIFGLFFGGSTVVSAFWNRKLINSFLAIEDDKS
jgi:hypothetical protein